MGPEIILGTVQMGTVYGIKNMSSVSYQPNQVEAHAVLDAAYNRGIRHYDTARDYGSAEQVIGNWPQNIKIKIQTKIKDSINLEQAEQFFRDSLEKLRVKKVYSLSLHVFAEVLKSHNLKLLENLKSQGLIEHTGVSVYTNQEMLHVLEHTDLEIIQFPFNILDNYYLRGETIQKAKLKNRKLHVRSIFLQGLLLMKQDQIPDHLQIIWPALKKLQILAIENKVSVRELCIAYVLSQKDLDGVIFGVDSVVELNENLDSIDKLKKIKINFETLERIEVDDDRLLNPALWNSLRGTI